jgi:hypothetical protein
MDHKLLVIAASFAALIAAAPAQAQQWSGTHPSARFVAPSGEDGFGGCGDGRHRHDRQLDCTTFTGGWAYADGDWARANNRSWQPDSYNDWWHDRPDRAFPRWVQHNQNCTPDRMWWSGSGWHC